MRIRRLLASSVIAASALLAGACGGTSVAPVAAPSAVPDTSSAQPSPPSPPPTPPGQPNDPNKVHWSRLPPLSEAAKSFIVNYNLNSYYGVRGAVKKWQIRTIRIYADPGFGSQALADATKFWSDLTHGNVSFTIADNSSSADVTFQFDTDGSHVRPGDCGVEGPDPLLTLTTIASGHGWYLNQSKCAPGGDWKIGLAHGIGHMIGLAGHTASGADVMGTPQSTWGSSQLLSEIINWLYNPVVLPGMEPID